MPFHFAVESMPISAQESSNPNGYWWDRLSRSKIDYLTALATTIEQGVLRQDTTHPAFCGCIDWHSSVHGVWALLAAARLTGKQEWVHVAESILQPERLEGERHSLNKGELDHELPYGFSWFLKLAQERERWSGKTDLLPLASEIAERLESWIFGLSDEAVIWQTQNRKYGNLSWAVLKLWEWSRWKSSAALSEKLAGFTADRLLPLHRELPPSLDEQTDEFFPAFLHRTRAILAMVDPKAAKVWLSSYDQERIPLEPLKTAPFPHSAGLNFSRSWGFWDLYTHTGNAFYREQFARHVVTHMNLPQYWREDYAKYGHWVAQFGVYAIGLSMEGEEG